MEKKSTIRSQILLPDRAAKLAKELAQLKKEFKCARMPFKRACIADEIKAVAAELARYTTR